MNITNKIKACQSQKQLDDLRDEIDTKARRNEIDFKAVKQVFMWKKKQLRDRAWGYQA